MSLIVYSFQNTHMHIFLDKNTVNHLIPFKFDNNSELNLEVEALLNCCLTMIMKGYGLIFQFLISL